MGCDAHEPASVAEPVNVRQTRAFAEELGITLDEDPACFAKAGQSDINCIT